MTRRGPHTAIPNTRCPDLRRLSQPKPKKLPVKNVNKASKRLTGQKGLDSLPLDTSTQESSPDQTSLNIQSEEDAGSPSPGMDSSLISGMAHTDSCDIAHSDDAPTDLTVPGEKAPPPLQSSHVSAPANQSISDQSPVNQSMSDDQAPANQTLSNSTHDDPSEATSIPVREASRYESPDVQLQPGFPDRHLSHSFSDPCLHSSPGRLNSSCPTFSTGSYAYGFDPNCAPSVGTAGVQCDPSILPHTQNQQSELSSNEAHFLKYLESNPPAPWHMAFHQLKVMGGRMAQLDTIQEKTSMLKSQMSQVLGRTQQLESNAQHNTSDFEALK